ncbi:MAG: hypothetical protein KA327_03150 [Pseudarcicella sp.]|nr:hypothetical protein [Pseudarcicella sp.]
MIFKKRKFKDILFVFTLITLVIGLVWFYYTDNQQIVEGNYQFPEMVDSLNNEPIDVNDSLIFDTLDESDSLANNLLLEYQDDNQIVFEVKKKQKGFVIEARKNSKIIASKEVESQLEIVKFETADLNEDKNTEVLFFNKNKKWEMIGYELIGNKFISFILPKLLGRQAMGYAGGDSLFLENNKIKKSFRFNNDQFALFPNGTRVCEYQMGFNRNFNLIQSLDFEK